MSTSPTQGSMLGGYAVNVSGPCIRAGHRVVVLFDELTASCQPIDHATARCILPTFHKIGFINIKMSVDGGISYPYVGLFNLSKPFFTKRRRCRLDWLTRCHCSSAVTVAVSLQAKPVSGINWRCRLLFI